MPKSTNLLLDQITAEIQNLKPQLEKSSVGEVVEIIDGVALAFGLSDAEMMEMVEFPHGEQGVIMNLEEGQVAILVLDDYSQIKEGDIVKRTQKTLSIPVSDQLIGRVINPLGQTLDDGKPLKAGKLYPINRDAPSVIVRESVKQPLQTGIKAVDSLTPIGRGQRQLIIGDRQIGKTALVVDTIINQKDQDVICIYVAIGQKEAKTARIVAKLAEAGAMDHTIIVNSSASQPAALNYLAPFAGCAVAEYFMDQGKDALIIYDDLSKHAVAYRQISLILKRPPGREAYPGDIFYLHSRLLERAAKLNAENGGGSITALPIIETQAGEISAYIPTNVISITDGQIYLETDLFYRGTRPAINAGLSVSRVGSSAQTKAMKKVAGKMRVTLAQFRELEAFSQFGADLDSTTSEQLNRGRHAVEVLKQPQYAPLSMEKQAVIYYALNNGYLDQVDLNRVSEYEERLFQFISQASPKFFPALAREKDLTEDMEKELVKLLEKFAKQF